VSPCGVFASAAFDKLENDSITSPGVPEIPPSSSTTTTWISSPEPDLVEANGDVPGAPSTES
jgi:hypothetical protein